MGHFPSSISAQDITLYLRVQVESSVYRPRLAVAGYSTQLPVGPALEQLAEDFTQLAWEGQLLKIQEMNQEKTRKFHGNFDFINIQNAKQQTASEFLAC